MKIRRKHKEEHADNHRWIISYADFITLLFAFFVVMYSISSVNDSKYRSLSEGMKSAFNKKDANKATQSTDNLKDGPETKKTKGRQKDGMDDLNKSLSALDDGSFKTNHEEGWIELDIKAGSLFDPGSAELKPEALIKLMMIAGKIKGMPYTVAVEGYTDNIPITSPQYPSNWELSATRAATVGRVLNSFGVATENLIITGYGDQFPLEDNATEYGRNQNRRVNIVITKNRNMERLLNPNMGQVHKAFIGAVESVQSPESNSTSPDKKEIK